MTQINIHEAKTQLSRLIQAALSGEEIIIAKDHKPLVRLVPLEQPKARRELGSARGQIKLSEDFDAPLDDFQDYR